MTTMTMTMTTEAILIGLGGTGSHLVDPFHRLLSHHPNRPRKLVLLDGDQFEEGNAKRQLFLPEQIGRNKAEVAAARLSSHGIPVEFYPCYLNRANARNLLCEGAPLVITAVDNDPTRKLVCDTLQRLSDFVVVNPGNSLDRGQVSVWIRKNGNDLTPSLTERYSNIASPQGRLPGGCADTTPSSPQLITANALSAAWTLAVVQALLDETLSIDEVLFDAPSFRSAGRGAIRAESQTLAAVAA